ncbi:hypothetical protein K438DRAFT_1626109, partial [Mycena galopus ATCC 62051]
LPSHCLANNLWIGRRPWELQVLTFPEQLLVALLYPCVYIASKNSWHQETRGASAGNVGHYDLDIEGISAMVEGLSMPRPPEVLASVISVTYCTYCMLALEPGELPKNWIYNTFRARRDAVRRSTV